ncbi:hypothetical protein MKK84_23845 [Methylobacterium sp. E-065]|uniref:hypothetical protein n=1 Tax=Methylobacterium sp. E-065 TaxID=2836583 RepID=UPI001FB9AFEA|nr:hypothetical protein [Methylobacterium sp. E-065]MCJ2020426.1 hypothetical protein [Methylobacterium sp. E-065]
MSETTAGLTDTSEAGLSVTAAQAAISARLTEASALAKAALVCAHAGYEREAVRIVLDPDVPLSEAQTLHGASCLIGRINRKAVEATAPGD